MAQRFWGVLAMGSSLVLAVTPSAIAQSGTAYMGTAAGGQSINLDLGSIRQVSSASLDFVYFLGNERVYAQANCPGGYWVSFPERQVNRPQSAATQRMLSEVCSYLGSSPQPSRSRAGVALVFDPPSNVRVTPNGAILCSVRSRGSINIYGKDGQWYVTDFCGDRGYIHESQLRF